MESEKEIKLEIRKSKDLIENQNIKLIMRRPDNAVLGILTKMDITILDETESSCIFGKIDNSNPSQVPDKNPSIQLPPTDIWNTPTDPVPVLPPKIPGLEAYPPAGPVDSQMPKLPPVYDPVNKAAAKRLVRNPVLFCQTNQRHDYHLFFACF